MLQELLDSGHYEIQEITTPSERNQLGKVVVQSLTEATSCPNCHSTRIKRKGKHSRTMIDIFDEKAFQVQIVKQRYKCNVCNKTFFPTIENDYPTNRQITTKVLKRLETTILTTPTLSISKAAEQFGVGRTVASKILKKKIQELKAMTKSIHPCLIINFVPFSFSGKERCAVTGVTEIGEKLLLDFWPDYSQNSITLFLSKTTAFFDNIEIVFCKPDHQIISHAKMAFSCDVAIIHRFFQKAIETSKNDTGDGTYIRKVVLLEHILEIFKKAKSRTEFLVSYSNWFSNLSTFEQNIVSPFYKETQPYIQEYAIATEYDPKDTECDKLLKIISKFRKDNSDFDSMVFRLLYANEATMNSPNGSIVMYSINHMNLPVTKRINNFGIDIDLLYRSEINN